MSLIELGAMIRTLAEHYECGENVIREMRMADAVRVYRELVGGVR